MNTFDAMAVDRVAFNENFDSVIVDEGLALNSRLFFFLNHRAEKRLIWPGSLENRFEYTKTSRCDWW